MGRNRTLATPEAYPVAFLAAVRDGQALIYGHDLPWAPVSAAKRFRLLLALLRRPEWAHHPLHRQAKRRWSVRPHGGALEIIVGGGQEAMPSLSGPLVDRALGLTPRK